ncbi:MAG: serine/threonine-protein kinase PknK [Phototrophicaceae bacterium]
MDQIISNRYQLEALIGSGGMGAVYRATDLLTDEVIALKRLTIDHQNLEFANADTISSRMALTQEFHILSGIRHPHIVSVLDYGFDERKQPFFTMELIHNPHTLYSYAVERPLAEKYVLLGQVLHALNYLHRRGILHRDLKPANILVGEGKARLLDFGLAVAAEHLKNQEDDGSVVGTLAYLAPETMIGTPASFASDLYSFGVVAYELLTGHHPFSMTSPTRLMMEIFNTPADVSSLSDMPAMQEIIERLLMKSPDDRYASVGELFQDYFEATEQQSSYETVDIRDSYLQSAKFVGREHELARLRGGLMEALQQRGSIYLLGGESGVGKSRLVEQLRTHALVDGALVLRGQALSEGGLLYQLWRPVLRYMCLFTPLSDFEASVLKLLVPDLERLLKRPIPDAPEIAPAASQERLFTTIGQVFRRQSQPMLILVEDLHWAGESLLILKEIGQFIQDLPVMIVGTYRNDELPRLAEMIPTAQNINLNRLSTTEIESLSAFMLGIDPTQQPQLIALLQRETEGNALFIVEVMRMLAEDAGKLEQITQMNLPEQAFTGGMQAILKRRLAQVPTADYAILELAAVAGRRIQTDLLVYLYPKIQLDQWLAECATVLEVQANDWVFAHDKLREIVIASLEATRLKQLHAQIGLGMEKLYPDLDAYAAVLAYHWQGAQLPQKEYPYRLKAGQQALKNANYREALTFFERAIQLADELQLDMLEKMSLKRYVGETYFGLGELAQGYGVFIETLSPLNLAPMPQGSTLDQHIQDMAADPLRYSGALSKVAFPQAIEYYRNAIFACEMMSMVQYFKNDKYPAVYHALVGLELAVQVGEACHNEQIRLQALMSLMASLIPLQDAAHRYNQQANAALEQNDQPETRMWVLLMAGIYATNSATWSIAIPALEESIQLTRKVGNMRRHLESILALAAVYYFHGLWDQSLELAEQLYDLGIKQENRQSEAWGLDDRARVMYRRGRHAESLPLLIESIQIYQSIHDTGGTIWVHGGLANIYMRLGDFASAEPHAQQARQLLRETRSSSYGVLEGCQGMTEFYVQRYEATPSNVEFGQDARDALSMIQEYAAIFSIGRTHALLYSARIACVEHRPAQAIQHGQAALQAAITHGQPYEAGLSAYYLARFVGNAHADFVGYTQQAETYFQQVGAAYDLELLAQLSSREAGCNA